MTRDTDAQRLSLIEAKKEAWTLKTQTISQKAIAIFLTMAIVSLALVPTAIAVPKGAWGGAKEQRKLVIAENENLPTSTGDASNENFEKLKRTKEGVETGLEIIHKGPVSDPRIPSGFRDPDTGRFLPKNAGSGLEKALGSASIAGLILELVGDGTDNGGLRNIGKSLGLLGIFGGVLKGAAALKSIGGLSKFWSAMNTTTVEFAGKLSFFAKASGALAIVGGVFDLVEGIPRAANAWANGHLLDSQEGRSGLLTSASGTLSIVGGACMFIPGAQPVAAVLLGASAVLKVADVVNNNWDVVSNPSKWGKAAGDFVGGLKFWWVSPPRSLPVGGLI